MTPRKKDDSEKVQKKNGHFKKNTFLSQKYHNFNCKIQNFEKTKRSKSPKKSLTFSNFDHFLSKNCQSEGRKAKSYKITQPSFRGDIFINIEN